MNNAEWCKQHDIKLAKLACVSCANPEYEAIGYWADGVFIDLYRSKGLSHLADESILIWLDMEHEDRKEVLTLTEREYLGAFIKPFRDRIKGIEKDRDVIDNAEYLYFHMDNDNDDFCLPNFQMKTMYKGMKVGIEYTLRELYLR